MYALQKRKNAHFPINLDKKKKKKGPCPLDFMNIASISSKCQTCQYQVFCQVFKETHLILKLCILVTE